jgi:Flp pilus assembly protein TadG
MHSTFASELEEACGLPPPIAMKSKLTRDKRVAEKRRNGGHAILELALIGPWVFLLFIGALDWGFYACALISLQAAARTAALYTSTSAATVSDSTTACSLVLGEMANLPNIGTVCSTNPVVTATSVTGPDSATATQVSITYTSVALIPLPGLLRKQFTITRTVKMRLRS